MFLTNALNLEYKHIESGKLYTLLYLDNVALLTARKGLDPRQGYVAADNVYSPIRTISGGISLNF
jgi:hypothetical protein